MNFLHKWIANDIPETAPPDAVSIGELTHKLLADAKAVGIKRIELDEDVDSLYRIRDEHNIANRAAAFPPPQPHPRRVHGSRRSASCHPSPSGRPPPPVAVWGHDWTTSAVPRRQCRYG